MGLPATNMAGNGLNEVSAFSGGKGTKDWGNFKIKVFFVGQEKGVIFAVRNSMDYEQVRETNRTL